MKIAPILVLALVLAAPASAQTGLEGLVQDESLSGTAIQLFLVVTVLSLAPGIAIMVTCFPFIVTVLAILRQAIGLQQSPPNMLLVSLAMFLTYYVMDPVFREAWTSGVEPFLDEQIEVEAALAAAYSPFETFMSGRVDQDTVMALQNMRNLSDTADPGLYAV